MTGSPLSIEEVDGRAAFRRFFELPHLLFHREPRWAPPVLAFDRARLDRYRNPYLASAETAFFLVRRLGRPVGRIAAHIPAGADPTPAAAGDPVAEGEGRFGFFDVEDDAAAAALLLDTAAEWLRAGSCTSMSGPYSFWAADEAGLRVGGTGAGATGSPWHPEWYATAVAAAGFAEGGGDRWTLWDWPTDEAATEEVLSAPGPALAPAGPYDDPRLRGRLLLGTIAAIPDVGGEGGGGGLGRRKRRAFEGAVVLSCEGDPQVLVPPLLAAARTAGYRWVRAPLARPDVEPASVHARFTRDL